MQQKMVYFLIPTISLIGLESDVLNCKRAIYILWLKFSLEIKW